MNVEFPFHELANVFPLIEGAQFAELVEDVRQNGVLDSVVLYNWEILDGRNRYRAAMEAGVECPFIAYGGPSICNVEKSHDDRDGYIYTAYFENGNNDDLGFSCGYGGEIDDPLSFVISKNLKRRHLDASQRAMVGAKLATMRQGERTDLAPIGAMSDEHAAGLLNVSERSVERAKSVQRDGVPDLVGAVEQGDVAVSAAADFAKQPKEDQAEQIAAAATPADAVKAFRESLPTKGEADKIARKLEAETGNTHAVLGKDGKYHAGATDAERESGDIYLRMSGVLRSVVALSEVSAAVSIASVSPQSRSFFPALLDDAERVLASLKKEWSKVYVEEAEVA
jgi:hypothetical protein